MNTLALLIRRARPGRGAYGLLVLLAATLLVLGSAGPAFALPPDPIDEYPNDFPPPENGFNWHMPSRYGLDQNGDGVTDYVTDPAFINPSSFKVYFKGCPSAEERSLATRVNRYRWKINGSAISVRGCDFSRNFAPGTYTVELTVTAPDGGVSGDYTQQVTVRDYLIVALGDSFGAGEGNPDVPQQFDNNGFVSAGPRWVDRRCHRSAAAGAAQAALALEQGNRHTSVTFVSLACSGATISHVINGGYGGIEPVPGEVLESQLAALRNIVGSRRIDALVISVGGNDVHFADILKDCTIINWASAAVAFPRCDLAAPVLERLEDDLEALPTSYNDLAARLAALNVGHVYFTEYPNVMRDASGNLCPSVLGEALPGSMIDSYELTWAEAAVLGVLNTQVQAAVARAAAAHPAVQWHYVDGIDEAFAGQGYGHGYCAGDQAWVRLIHDSARMQGPLGATTHYLFIPPWELDDSTGTMHPTHRGQQAYRDQLLPLIVPNLAP